MADTTSTRPEPGWNQAGAERELLRHSTNQAPGRYSRPRLRTTRGSPWSATGNLECDWNTTEMSVRAKEAAVANGRVGAKERALAYVRKQVLSGAFPGGELISEGEVAQTLNMSRTPVREAFLRLEAEGLLRLYPQRGALVVPVSPDEVRSVIEARLVLEQFAAGKVTAAGQTERDAVFTDLDVQLRRQDAADVTADIEDFLEADRAFHTVLVDAAANPILGSVYESLRNRQMRMVGESALRSHGRIETIVAEHRDIAKAVRAGDTDRALEAVRRHLASTTLALGMTADS